jgi:hypothetical protein
MPEQTNGNKNQDVQTTAPATVDTAQEQGFGKSLTHQRAEMAAVQVAKEAESQVNARFIMAMKKPRNEDKALARILNSCRNLHFADSAIYKKPVGNTTIEGASIRLAEEIARNWGNLYINSSIIYEDEARRIIRIMVLDLEANLDYDKTITIEKVVERRSGKGREVLDERLNTYGDRVFIVRATEDEMVTKENAQISKAMRNGILRCIPHHIQEEAMLRCKKTIKARIDSDPAAAKNDIIRNFSALNIMPDQIEKYLGHGLAQITSDEIADLLIVYRSIKDKQTTWRDIMDSKVIDADATASDEADVPEANDWDELEEKIQKSKATASKVTDSAKDQSKKKA